MNQNKLFPFFVFGLLVVVVTAFYTLKTASSHKGAKNSSVDSSAPSSVVSTAANPSLENLKNQELFNPATEQNVPAPARIASTHPSRITSPRIGNKGRRTAWENRPATSVSEGNEPYSPAGNFRASSLPTQAQAQGGAFTGKGNGRFPTSPAGGTPSYTSGQMGQQASGKQDSSDSPFSPYLASLTKEQAAALEKQLDGLPDRVEAAILRALLPKSKKDTNIEKYLSRNSSSETSANTSGPFAPVARQMARQKAGIVNSMKKAFGDKAAKQAGQIMDAYENDIMNTLNQPDLTQEQIKQKTRQISDKYNNQLKQLTDKEAEKHLQNELEKRDEALLARYQQAYDPKIVAGMADILSQFRARELELAQAGLSQEEYLEKMLALDRERDSKMRDFLTKNKQSLAPYINAPAQEEQNPKGKSLPMAYQASPAEQKSRQQDIAARSATLLKKATELYGEDKAPVFETIYQNYAKEMADIWADPETTLDEKNEKSDQALQKSNDAIGRAQLQVEEDNYIQAALNSPELSQASADQRDAFERHARSVLDDRNRRIDQIRHDPNLSPAEQDKQIKLANEVAQRQLAFF